MGDQEITFADVDWSEDSHMEECDPGAPLTEQASSGRNPDYTHEDFAHKLKAQILPNDQENRGEFDVGTDCRIGDAMFTFELPLQCHMKLLRRLASRTGTFCSATFSQG